MARIKKKGKAGQAKNFITRTQAVRKLQVSLPDFRRLCIFKGVYPREPRNKKKASKTSGPNTTFYYSKDIQYLLHEPLLAKFREHKAVSKKIARSLGKGQVGDAARLDKIHNKKLSLDHVIKERYPTFIDALRDLDDALSLLFLFSNLPSTSTVPAKTISLCQRLCHEFQHYLIVSHSLRKSFLSIKGIYYQATIQGQDILWLVPHKFVQRVTGDVDFRIMGTFVEFYTTLLGFVNYRLYSTIGLIYPPKFDPKSDEQGGELNALKLENRGLKGLNGKSDLAATDSDQDGILERTEVDPELQKRVDKLTKSISVIGKPDLQGKESEGTLEFQKEEDQTAADVIETFDDPKSGDILLQPSAEPAVAGSLFTDMVFFLNRETPRQPLEFLLRASGAKRLGWDAVLGSGAFTNDELDPSITHQIVDRPPIMADSNQTELQDTLNDEDMVAERPRTFQHGYRVPGRTYVQPQWVWDCVNAAKILRADLYAPGALLPPHLSPFVKARPGEYDPNKSLAEQEREGEVEEFEEAEQEARLLEQNGDDEDAIKVTDDENAAGKDSKVDENGMQVASSDDEDGDEEDTADGDSEEEAEGEISPSEADDIDEEAGAHALHQAELEAEAQGVSVGEVRRNGVKGLHKEVAGNDIRKKAEKKRRVEQEERERLMGMMPRKKKKLYEKMQYGLKRDSDQAEKLRAKRRRLESASGM